MQGYLNLNAFRIPIFRSPVEWVDNCSLSRRRTDLVLQRPSPPARDPDVCTFVPSTSLLQSLVSAVTGTNVGKQVLSRPPPPSLRGIIHRACLMNRWIRECDGHKSEWLRTLVGDANECFFHAAWFKGVRTSQKMCIIRSYIIYRYGVHVCLL